MNIPVLEKDCYYEYKNRIYRCVGRGPGGRFGLHKVKGTGQVYMSIADVRKEALAGHFKKINAVSVDEAGEEMPDYRFSLSTLSAEDQRLVESRQGYMLAIKKSRQCTNPPPLSVSGLTPLLKEEFDRQVAHAKECNETPPTQKMSVSAAIRWWRAWRESGEAIESLVQDRVGNCNSRLTTTQDHLLDAAIMDHYLVQDGPSIKAAHAQLKLSIKRHNLMLPEGAKREKVPGYRAALRRIKRMDQYQVLAARTNSKYADAVFRTYGVTPATSAPFERLQMDHTMLDVRVGCENTYVVRPWLTILYDVHNSTIPGFYLSEEPPSYRSVMECLRMAILPKESLLTAGDGTWLYPMSGVPQELLVDNGKEFHSRSLVRACGELGIILRYTPPRQPWFKAQVERTFGVLNTTLLRSLVGRIYKGKAQLKEEQLPLMTIHELHKLILQWICTVFHQQPLPKIGKSPLQMWNEWEKTGNRIPLPVEENTVRLALAQEAPKKEGKCQLGPSGIHLHNTRYASPLLTMLRRNHGKCDVPVRFDAGDVGRIWVLDKAQRRFFPVPSVETETHGVSLFAHKLIHRERNAQIKAGNEDCTYLEAQDALVQAINDLTEKKRQQVGTKAARFTNGLRNQKKAKTDEQKLKEEFMEDLIRQTEIKAGWHEEPASDSPTIDAYAANASNPTWTNAEPPARAENEVTGDVSHVPAVFDLDSPIPGPEPVEDFPNVVATVPDDDWDVPESSISRINPHAVPGATHAHP